MSSRLSQADISARTLRIMPPRSKLPWSNPTSSENANLSLNAPHSTFNDIARDQINTYNYYASQIGAI